MSKPNNRYIFLVVGCLMCLPQLLLAGDDIKYPVFAIPDSLKQGANVVLREESQIFIQSDVNNATYKVTRVVTILNRSGDEYTHFRIYQDKFRELTDFSGVIRDALGNVIKKIKKSDLKYSSISESAGTTDNTYISYECYLPSYPCTVEYTYQEKWKNGILAYPGLFPYEGYAQSVEKVSFRIETPTSVQIRERNNFGGTLKKEVEGNKNIYTILLNNQKAISLEPLSPSYTDIFPWMRIAPADMFCYDSHCGSMKDWNSYGLWINDLLQGRDVLTPQLTAKLQELVQGAKTECEKVQIVFDYLQKNTRYVNIQLGIGGYQPFDALTVSKMSFGDCKGLTNLMKAMLSAVGVDSRYTLIKMDDKEKDLLPDFPNFFQMNHVILMIPQKNDSIWLECTSQTLPFGYVHQDIAGHNAIVVSDRGGQMVRLPAYADKQNLKETKVEIVLDDNGGASGKIFIKSYLDEYEGSVSDVRSNDRERIVRHISHDTKFPQLKIGKYTATEDRSSYPSTRIEADYISSDFGNRTGSRLFIPLCPLSKENFNILTAATRYKDIERKNGYVEADSIIITLPTGYTVESLPKDVEKSTPFGVLKTQAKAEDNRIIYTQTIDIYSGRFDRSQYAAMKDFFAQITATVQRNIVLKKQ